MPRIRSHDVRPEPRSAIITLRQRVVGTVAGAMLCAIARAGISLAFFYYASSWWGGGPGVLEALISGLIGLPIGAVAGWTCQPLMGASIGGASSGFTCFCLFVVPAELFMALHPREIGRIETLQAISGLTAMIVAGAIAGGLGAAVGKHAAGADTAAARHRKRKG